ncbi:hypothetical protein FD049_12140 [Salmonella enterica subsp. enterica serovar Kentucky]|nr:hypothetical protein [Salmonella enterica subsp. enterica serovar Kentucky]EBO1518948.1 hypothetical protein [Salmonella enterica subsp. enterica serovar Kentucky]ECI8322544.1 hypothetical protein [Salmonella enterica subsp. enterica serovar Kentucky]ECR6055197.1 hypothetical protein [Salmonella enterica subsp. enterica serovar Kentucky]EDC8116725.1 hypothetical protein [Salmonella enterica subsp. enterica serovar Kentucky]
MLLGTHSLAAFKQLELFWYMFFREPYRIAPCYQACGCNITIPKRNGIQKTSIMNEENLLRDWIQIIVESA